MSLKRAARILPIAFAAACTPSSTVGSPSPDASTSYVVRLGGDTVAVERFSRAGNRIESAIVVRGTQIVTNSSNIELGANGLATSWRYEGRRPDGTRPPNGATTVFTFGTDSTTIQVTRDTGATITRRIAGGGAIPSVNNSMLTQNLVIAYARMQGRDSVSVPLIGPGGARSMAPVRFITRDSVRLAYGPDPVFVKLDGDGQIRWLDGSASTNKIVAARVPRVDVVATAAAFAAAGAPGAASTRDTARAQIMGVPLWIDYGRPLLRGRNVWSNGVLGDTLWRTGANQATHFRTESDLRIAGQTIPAGTYTLWTRVPPSNSSYELIFNRRTGIWGAPIQTVYDRNQDVARVPLTVRSVANSAERFTMMIEPSGEGGIIAMQWGTTRLETPFTIVRR